MQVLQSRNCEKKKQEDKVSPKNILLDVDIAIVQSVLIDGAKVPTN